MEIKTTWNKPSSQEIRRNDGERWQAQLVSLGADQDIPEAFLNDPSQLLPLANSYLKAAVLEDKHTAYVRLSERAYEHVLSLPGHEDDLMALRGLAYLYYREFNYYSLWRRQIRGKMFLSKDVCENKAIELYDRIIAISGNTGDYYRYAYLLYNSSTVFSPDKDFSTILEKKRQAYDLYHLAVTSYDSLDEKRRDSLLHIYIKASYGLARCGLELINSRSRVLDELVVLFDYDAPTFGNRLDSRNRLIQVCDAIEIVREFEGLPAFIDDMDAIIKKKHLVEHSWDVYYTLGKAQDLARQYKLADDTEQAYADAERYYRYACEIDAQRRENHLPVSEFTHMYMALFNLYLRNRQESAFKSAWQRYSTVVPFSLVDKLLFQARWHIVKRDYSRAGDVLQECQQKRGITSGASKKADLLLDMIHLATQGINADIEKKYKPYQLKQFNNLRLHLNDIS